MYFHTVRRYTSFTDSGIAHLTAGKQVNWIDHIRPVQDPVIRALIKNEENIVQVRKLFFFIIV